MGTQHQDDPSGPRFVHQYLLGADHPVEKALSLSYDEFGELITGSAITGFSRVSEKAFRVELTGDLAIQIFEGAEGLEFALSTTLSEDSQIPIPLYVPDVQQSDISSVAQVLTAIGTLYSIILALELGRRGQLHKLLEIDRDADPQSILDTGQHLELLSFANGSWWAKFQTGSKNAYQVCKTVVMFVSEKGRESLDKRRIADDRIKEAEAAEREANARKAAHEADKAAFERFKDMNDYYRKEIQPLPEDDPIRQRFEKEIEKLAGISYNAGKMIEDKSKKE